MRFLVADAETLSTSENGVILDFSFIAVDFNKRLDYTADELIDVGVKWKFDIKEQIANGRHVDQSTVKWWQQQEKSVRKLVLPSDNDVSLYSLVPRIEEYLKQNEFTRQVKTHNFWFASRGELEVKLMHGLYQELGMTVQQDGFYDFNRWRDIRTMLHFLAGAESGYIDVRDETQGLEKHNSLHDVVIDILQMQKALKGYE